MTKGKPAKDSAAKGRENGNGGVLGFEADLFKTADKLRDNIERDWPLKIKANDSR